MGFGLTSRDQPQRFALLKLAGVSCLPACLHPIHALLLLCLCSNVVQMYSVLHVPKACVTDSSVSRSSKRNPHGGSCWGLLIEYLQVGGGICLAV